jgi:sugar phosphate isomerase/epimerase
MASTTSFHWGAPADRTWHEPARFVEVCRRAASAGFESVDIPHTPGIAEAIALAAAAAGAIRDVRFRLTCPSPASLGVALADEVEGCAAARRALHPARRWTTTLRAG